MKLWPFQYAKAHFSKLLKAYLREGPQVATKRGSEAVVLVPIVAWRRLQPHWRPTLKELLLVDEPRLEIPIRRYNRKRRAFPDMG